MILRQFPLFTSKRRSGDGMGQGPFPLEHLEDFSQILREVSVVARIDVHQECPAERFARGGDLPNFSSILF
jgi:hypothetical protein